MHGGGDRVVRFRLHGVTGRPAQTEQRIDDDARAAPGVAVDHRALWISERRGERFLDALAGKARVVLAIDDPLHAPIAGDQRHGLGHQVTVVLAGRRIHQMDARDVAFAALAAARPPMLPTYSDFARKPLPQQLSDEKVETDAMAADDHEIGGLEPLPEQLHRHRRAGIDDLGVLIDGDEAVGSAECGNRTGALAHRIGGEAVRRRARDPPAGTRCAPLGVDPHRQERRHGLPALRGTPA